MGTPGHTDEHLSFLLRDGGSPGRGVHRRVADRGLRSPHRPARSRPRPRSWPGPSSGRCSGWRSCPTTTAVWPTHGAGSFCSAPPGAERTSTIGRELATNPLLGIDDEDRFVEQLLGSLGSHPPYFLRLAEINRRGPAVLDPTTTGRLAAAAGVRGATAARRRCGRGGRAPGADYARAHIPGAVSIPLRAQFATWLGWLVPADAPIVVVRNPDQDLAELVWQAVNIGVERLVGELAGGIDAWTAAGQADRQHPPARPRRDRPAPSGARRPPGRGVHRRAPARRRARRTRLTRRGRGRAADAPTVVMCGHGERAAGAASLLERAGHHDLAVLEGGPDDWAQRHRQPLDTGS